MAGIELQPGHIFRHRPNGQIFLYEGEDSDTGRGGALADALLDQQEGDYIKVGPGTYSIPGGAIYTFEESVHLDAAGWSTIIQPASGNFSFRPRNGCKYSNFHIIGNGLFKQDPDGGVDPDEVDDVTFDRLKIEVQEDAIITNTVEGLWVVRDCFLLTRAATGSNDITRLSGNAFEIEFWNCKFLIQTGGVAGLNAGGIEIGDTSGGDNVIARAYNCVVIGRPYTTVSTSVDCLIAYGSNAKIFMYGGEIRNENLENGQSRAAVANGGAEITLANVVFDPALLVSEDGGTIVAGETVVPSE